MLRFLVKEIQNMYKMIKKSLFFKNKNEFGLWLGWIFFLSFFISWQAPFKLRLTGILFFEKK
jgi:hypothetical protein